MKKLKSITLLLGSLALAGCTGGGIKHQGMVLNLNTEPATLHPIRSTDAVASQVQSYVLDSLLTRDIKTFQWKPALATKWSVSPGHTHFTFTLRKNAFWPNGTPVTAGDVAFSFKALKDPSYGGVHLLPYYENIESVKILSSSKVQFKVSKKYFKNFDTVAGLTIIPEYIYKDKSKKFTRILPGSGPYILKQYDKGRHIILTQNPRWWGRGIYPNTHRISQITFKFIPDENDQLIRMQAGDLDMIGLSVEAYEQKTNKPPWGISLIKKEVRNKQSSGYNYIGWNLKQALFQNPDTRQALAHLMNRELINQKFNYNKKVLATGPWYKWNDYADSSVKPVLFDPAAARKLLHKAGWYDTDKNGVLDKKINDKKTEFRFTLIYANKDSEKYYTLYQEDLKKNGILMQLRFMDWSAFLKLLNEKKFSAVALAWSGGSVDPDPKQIWHSDSARPGGSNFISYSNAKVDALIDKGRMEMNKSKRIALFKEVYRLIAKDHPYLFLFNTPVWFYAHNRRIITQKDFYPYGLGTEYWQIRPE